MLTGSTRYRLSWSKKIILQVSEWQHVLSLLGQGPMAGYKPVWRDATFQDVIDLERGNFSKEKPKTICRCRR